jgi:two-component system LytT family sensor kinase
LNGRVKNRNFQLWTVSFAVWTFVSIAATATVYQLYRPLHSGMDLKTIAGMEFSQILTYAPLTPFAYLMATRFPIQKANWIRRSFLHLCFGLAFTIGHIFLKMPTPYAYWDPALRDWTSALWNPEMHVFRISWTVLQGMFFGSVVDDVTSAYVPIVITALAISYYQRSRQGELRAAQLESQLATARLQTLKSQLQPHFLFNTMHSISALMLIDVQAADRMMCQLSDLLRISLETSGTQMTSLKRELEFVNCYLEIEKVRFEERLNVLYEISPETLDAEIPHLLLQPIVDNAVKHGISKLPAGGQISIRSARRDGKLEIEITNARPSASRTKSNGANGIGLRVTRERLESLYGEHQTFELLDSIAGVKMARVRIPYALPSGLSPTDTASDKTE